VVEDQPLGYLRLFHEFRFLRIWKQGIKSTERDEQ
jgi:hypothetical protein